MGAGFYQVSVKSRTIYRCSKTAYILREQCCFTADKSATDDHYVFVAYVQQSLPGFCQYVSARSARDPGTGDLNEEKGKNI